MASISNILANSRTSAPSGASAGQPGLDGDSFIKLLLAQLQHQDPFQPMDPTQMVGQLVQFNTLNELIRIRQDIEAAPATNSATAPAAANPNRPQF